MIWFSLGRRTQNIQSSCGQKQKFKINSTILQRIRENIEKASNKHLVCFISKLMWNNHVENENVWNDRISKQNSQYHYQSKHDWYYHFIYTDICCYLLIILPLLLLIADSTVNNIFTDVYAEGFDNYFVYLRFTVSTQNCWYWEYVQSPILLILSEKLKRMCV